MKLQISQGSTSRELDVLEGASSVGSGPSDDVRLPGVPERFIKLHREGDRVMVEGTKVFSIDGVMVPPRVPRLLLLGERVQLPGDASFVLVSPAQKPQAVGTVAVLRQFLAEPGADPQALVPHLICLTGLDAGKRMALCDGTSSIGRGEEMTIRIRDRAVSRCHARLLKLEAGFALEQASTANGVYVNGSRLGSRTLLRSGDIVELGQTLLRFEEGPGAEEQRPAADAPAPGLTSGAQAGSSGGQVGRRRPGVVFGWSEWLLIAGGAVLTLIGLVVTFSLLD